MTASPSTTSFCWRPTSTRKDCFSSRTRRTAPRSGECRRLATPLYGRAKRIYALHTDRHSTFWSHPAFDEETKKRFLTPCPTVRLFLYSSSEKMFNDLRHQDHDVLNYQAAHYAASANSDP